MILTIEEFAGRLNSQGTILGLDVSKKSIGLAVSDPAWRLALPLTAIKRSKLLSDIEALDKIIVAREVAGLVLGLPLNMDDTQGPRAQSIRTFAANLMKHIALPLTFWDERLSTFEAGQAMAEVGISRAKRDEKIDALAAAVILQGALDGLRAY